MNKEKNIRRIKYLIYKLHLRPLDIDKTVRERVDEMLTWVFFPKTTPKKDIEELKYLLDNTVISEKELMDLWLETYDKKHENNYSKQNKITYRDNKGVKIGSGYGGNRNLIRYPSKKRSLRTWKFFYTMFPKLAEKDEWDGKTSIKMN